MPKKRNVTAVYGSPTYTYEALLDIYRRHADGEPIGLEEESILIHTFGMYYFTQHLLDNNHESTHTTGYIDNGESGGIYVKIRHNKPEASNRLP